MTKNDFFYHVEFKDFKISYNPRCQLLDFTPNSYYFSNKNTILPYHHEQMTNGIKSFVDKMCWEFFLQFSIPLDKITCIRLYGVISSNTTSYEYTSILSENQNEWSQISNWDSLSLTFKTDPHFKYAYFGESDDSLFQKISPEDKKKSKQIKYKLKDFLLSS